MIVVNQSRRQPAAVIASPVVTPMSLVMPVPIGGYGFDHHFYHHYDCDTVLTSGSHDAPIAVRHYGGDSEDAAPSAAID